MPILTNKLGLTSYNTVTDASSVSFYTFFNQSSGSATTQNLGILDRYATDTSACIARGFTETSACIARGFAETSASMSFSASRINTLSASYAGTAQQVSSGSSIAILVSASSLADSVYGERTVCIQLNTSASLTVANINYVRIPSSINGWILVDAQASCLSPSTSGSITLMASRCTASAVVFTNMLSTPIVIDVNEYDSSTASQHVISTTASSVFTGYKIKISNSDSGSPATYVQASLTFRNSKKLG